MSGQVIQGLNRYECAALWSHISSTMWSQTHDIYINSKCHMHVITNPAGMYRTCAAVCSQAPTLFLGGNLSVCEIQQVCCDTWYILLHWHDMQVCCSLHKWHTCHSTIKLTDLHFCIFWGNSCPSYISGEVIAYGSYPGLYVRPRFDAEYKSSWSVWAHTFTYK